MNIVMNDRLVAEMLPSPFVRHRFFAELSEICKSAFGKLVTRGAGLKRLLSQWTDSSMRTRIGGFFSWYRTKIFFFFVSTE